MNQTESIAERIKAIRATLPDEVSLVAVSKFQPLDSLRAAYDAGQRIFGESHEQELRVKQPAMPADVEWHFIGHLQTNKVRYIAPYISLIHSVDSPRLLNEINRQAQRIGRTIPCLLQVHIAAEETKYGFTPEELLQYLDAGEWRTMKGVTLCGLMCMATNTDNEDRIAHDFQLAHNLFKQVQSKYFSHEPAFSQCSWGMSGDYEIAIQHGATLVRIGSSIFGKRIYQ